MSALTEFLDEIDNIATAIDSLGTAHTAMRTKYAALRPSGGKQLEAFENSCSLRNVSRDIAAYLRHKGLRQALEAADELTVDNMTGTLRQRVAARTNGL